MTDGGMARAAASRGALPGLASPHPLGALLPAMYQGDDFAQRFTGGLDDVLAPVLCVLDCLESYVDPDLAPADFVRWLASLVGVEDDETLPLENQRSMVRHAVAAYRLAGTPRGIAAAVAALVRAEVEVHDTGGAAWSTSADPPSPSSHPPLVQVTLSRTDESIDLRRIERTIAAAKPAHVPHVLIVPPGDERASGEAS